MRGFLFGTTALAVAGMGATGVSAAEKIKLGLGGYYRAYYAFANQKDGAGEPGANVRNNGMGRESEIYFLGSTTLDNGLTAGVNVQLEGETSKDQIDESYIYFKGGFGQIQLGSNDDAAEQFLIGAPGVVSGFGVMDPTFQPVKGGGNSASVNVTEPSLSGDADKIIYFTPRFNGVIFAASYAPDVTEESATGINTDNNPGNLSKIVSLTANYEGQIQGISLGLTAGYTHGNLKAPGGGLTSDQTVWGVGADLGLDDFTVSGGYRGDNQGTSGSHTYRTDWNVGVAYQPGPWAVSLGYGRTSVQEGVGAGEDTLNVGELAFNYVLGPGVAVGTTISMWDWDDNNGAPANQNKATVFTVGTRLDF